MTRDHDHAHARGAEAYSDAARLRQSDQVAADERSRTPHPPAAGAPALLVQTTTVTTNPTTAAAFYAVLPVAAAGTQTEGAAGSYAAGTAAFYALNLGTGIPPSGTRLVATSVSHRWVFRYDS